MQKTIAILLIVAACSCGSPDYAPPLWTVPGQKVRHLATKKTGTIREMYGREIIVDFADETIVCEPIKVVPIK